MSTAEDAKQQENEVVRSAIAALARAHQRMRRSQMPMLFVENGKLVRVNEKGEQHVVKNVSRVKVKGRFKAIAKKAKKSE